MRGVRHEVQRQLELVAAVGAVPEAIGLSLRIDEADREALAHKLRRGKRGYEELRSCAYVVVHPGASAPSRRYAPARFAVVARQVSRQLGVTIVFTGDKSERDVVGAIAGAAGADAINLAGELALGELVALIDGAELLISNNTGPVHIAAAVGTPVVDLYALTNPQHTPWQVPHRVLSRDVPCRDCYRSVCPRGDGACLDIAPDEVIAAVSALWRSSPASAARARSAAQRA
jgi:ADP-heptose:LPS heptosyltransferase